MSLQVLSREGDASPPTFALVMGEIILGQQALGFLWIRPPMLANAATEIVFFGRAVDGDFIEVVTSATGSLDHVAALDLVKSQELDGVIGKTLPTTPFSNAIAQRGYEAFLPTLQGLLIFARDAKAMERRFDFAESFSMATPFIDDRVLEAVDQAASVAEALTNAVAKQIIGDRSQFAFTDEHVERLRDAAWGRLPHAATAMFLLGHLKAEQMPRIEREGQCAIVLGRLMKAVQDQFAAFFEPGSRDEVSIPLAMLARGLDADWEALIALVESASGEPLEKAYDAIRGVDIACMFDAFDQMVLYWVPSEAWPRGRYRFATKIVLQGGNLVRLLRAFELYIKGPGGPAHGSICDDRHLSYEAWRPLLPAPYRDMTVEGFEAQMYRERAEADAADEVLA